MVIFNSYVKLPEGNYYISGLNPSSVWDESDHRNVILQWFPWLICCQKPSGNPHDSHDWLDITMDGPIYGRWFTIHYYQPVRQRNAKDAKGPHHPHPIISHNSDHSLLTIC